MAFLHGIEHINIPPDIVPVNDIVTAVIGLVGTAEKGPVNELVLCKCEADDARFGKKGTIPESLTAIRQQQSSRGNTLVFVVNVQDGSNEVKPPDIIGDVTETNLKTGMRLFENALPEYGFKPMIFIAPHFSAIDSVANALVQLVAPSEDMAYIDCPDDYTFDDAVKSKGENGKFAKLGDGQKLIFPQFKIANPAYVPEAGEPGEQFISVPMSAFLAGNRARVDMEEGWHISSSNHAIKGIEGVNLPLTFSLNDPSCEANLLNASGIVTAVNMYGNGIVEWGNYTAGYPGNVGSDAFECVRRSRAIIKRTIQQAAIPFIDKPYIQANVDCLRSAVNRYLNGLASDNKIVKGQCYYRKESNPVEQIAKGHIKFDIVFTPAVPMQQITFTYELNLSNLRMIA